MLRTGTSTWRFDPKFGVGPDELDAAESGTFRVFGFISNPNQQNELRTRRQVNVYLPKHFDFGRHHATCRFSDVVLFFAQIVVDVVTEGVRDFLV